MDKTKDIDKKVDELHKKYCSRCSLLLIECYGVYPFINNNGEEEIIDCPLKYF